MEATMKSNNLKRTILVTFAGLTAMLLCGNVSLAQDEDGANFGGKRAKFMQHVLDLSDEQVAEAEKIRQSYKENMMTCRENLAEARKTFRSNLEEEMDEAAVRQAFAPVAEAMQDIAIQRILMMQELKKNLTPEQAAKADELRELMPRGKGKRRGPFFGRPHNIPSYGE